MDLRNLKNIKQGFKDLTPLQFCQARLAGYIGTTVGAGLATITMFLTKSWGFAILLLFITWLQLVTIVSTKKEYDNLKQMLKTKEVI